MLVNNENIISIWKSSIRQKWIKVSKKNRYQISIKKGYDTGKLQKYTRSI